MANTTPIANPQRGFRFWILSDIYIGPNGTGSYVPNNNDLVLDFTSGFYQVVNVDFTTGLSTIIPWTPPDQNYGVVQSDVLLGSAPGAPSQAYRCYINTSVIPFSLALDASLYVYSTKAAYCKIFLGTDISVNGTVLSALVDQNNNIISENLTLSLVSTLNGNNNAIRSVNAGYCTQQLQNGELVTAVIYASDGTVLSYTKLLVAVTNFSRPLNASTKYITAIELISSFLSPTNSQLLQIPVNMLAQAMQLQGKVLYSDGTSVILPIDGSRFVLAGMANYVSSVVGQQVPLLLIYNFASNENGYNVNGVYPQRFMSVDYNITTVPIVGAYSVKIYAAPTWNPITNVYNLKYFMYNLDRNAVYDVSTLVSLVPPNVFNPNALNTMQNLVLSLNLNSIGSSFAYYIQTQMLNINIEYNNSAPAWWLQYSPSSPQVVGGGTAVVKITSTSVINTWNIDLSAGLALSSDWINLLYFNAQPLFDPSMEKVAPTPNYVRVIIGSNYTTIIPISSFNTIIPAITLIPPDPIQGSIVLFQFLYRDNVNSDQELGLGILPITLH